MEENNRLYSDECWEYRNEALAREENEDGQVFSYDRDSSVFVGLMNRLGAEGWECYQIVGQVAYFKRPYIPSITDAN